MKYNRKVRIGIDASRAFVDQPTGTERYSLEMLNKLLRLPDAKKHEWILYTKKLSIGSDQLTVNSGIKKFVKIQPILLPYLWTQIGLAARTWIDRLDVLWVPAHTLPVFRKPGLATVVTIHGIEYEWLPAYESVLQRWYLPLSTKYAAMVADRIISVSQFTGEQLAVRMGVPREKITVIHEGYTTDKAFQGNEKEREVILRKYGLEKQKYLVFVGTVQPRKNLDRLIEAFSRLSDRSLKLIIIGRLGWQYEGVLSAPEKWGVKDRVDIVGFISDTVRQVILENSLGYVQPSITEGYGLPVLEALAAGVPVATSVGGALTEIVTEETTRENVAILFDPTDVGDMVRGMEKLISLDKNARLRIIRKGQARAEKFTWEKAAQETLDLLIATRH